MKRPNAKRRLLTVAALEAAVLALLLWCFVSIGNITERLTVEAGTELQASDFRLHSFGTKPTFVTDMDTIDLSVPGEYAVTLQYFGVKYESKLQVVDTVAPVVTTKDLTLFSTQDPLPEDFIQDLQDTTQVAVTYATVPSMAQAGQQQVQLRLTDRGGNVTLASAMLTVVVDTTAPTLEGVRDRLIYLGQTADLKEGVTISDDLDSNARLIVDCSGVDQTKPGVYQVTYTAMDTSGNKTVKTAKLTVAHDTTGPQILGVNALSIYQGSTVSYRKGVIVKDDYDTAPSLSVDSSGVDLSQPGVYEVVYTATDAMGNTTTLTTTITIKEKPDTYVAEEVINQKADEILATIITDGMTDRDKVEAVYDWVTGNCWYISTSDKTDRLQGAYLMMTRKYGDCFNFYAVTSLFFDRLGIPYVSVQRSKDSVRPTSHYWALVSIDGGQTYYHVDACPHYPVIIRACLVTDADLELVNEQTPGYYTMDPGVYPATPTKRP